ncbi:hypothetical protein GCM10010430_57220 [Kitasatospora cystarginea]|uniref:Ferric oxidoreductase domain-containing protein n=1 Tax=Kitasatospora cystarginea TaxID=58350 RepID=A0ABN3EPW4_9ACTN
MTTRARHGRRAPASRPGYLVPGAVAAVLTGGAVAAGAELHWPVPGPLGGAGTRIAAFLDYFAGVFTLLSLTAAVVCGLLATDRLVLTPRLRVAVQSVHRATSVAALGFLGTHIAVKVLERHAAPAAAVLPFGGSTFAVSLGTVAADLLVLVAATGVLRGRFAGSRRPWLWRVLHVAAYACWPVALVHGLTAGRAAHAWVLWGYGLCAAGMALALLVRGLAFLGRRSTLGRLRRGAKAYRPATPSPAVLAELSVPHVAHARQVRTLGGSRPVPWLDLSQAARTVPRPRSAQQGPHRSGGSR